MTPGSSLRYGATLHYVADSIHHPFFAVLRQQGVCCDTAGGVGDQIDESGEVRASTIDASTSSVRLAKLG
jgi:hypothetical protein